MKALRAILAVMIIALVAVSFGCSKKKATEPVVTPPASTTVQIPNTQSAQTSAASGATGQITSGITNMSSMASGMSSGSPFIPSKYAGKTPPDTSWHAYTGGWYYVSLGEGTFIDTLFVRFTPDIWGANPGAKVTKYEYLMRGHGVENTTTINFNMDGLCQYMADTTMIQGHWYYGYYFVLSQGGYTMDWSYLWHCNFDNVSIVSGNHSCHFTYTCTWPFVDPNNPTTISRTDLSGEIKLDASGYGSLGTSGYAGYCASNGVTFVKYYSTSGGRYYTLAWDNFVTHYTW